MPDHSIDERIHDPELHDAVFRTVRQLLDGATDPFVDTSHDSDGLTRTVTSVSFTASGYEHTAGIVTWTNSVGLAGDQAFIGVVVAGSPRDPVYLHAQPDGSSTFAAKLDDDFLNAHYLMDWFTHALTTTD